MSRDEDIGFERAECLERSAHVVLVVGEPRRQQPGLTPLTVGCAVISASPVTTVPDDGSRKLV